MRPSAGDDDLILVGINVMALLEKKGKQKADVFYENPSIPLVIEENFVAYYNDNGEILLDVLPNHPAQSLQGIRDCNVERASSSNYPPRDPARAQSSTRSLNSINFKSQLLLDEALARQLQCVEENLAATYLCEPEERAELERSVGNDVSAAVGISPLETEQGDVVPENMTYEELQSLGEAIGTEGRGLPDELISFLPSSTYRTGFFSKKEKREECVICCLHYKNREALITLPCKHRYHSVCIRKWLKIRKVCPVCNEEVFGS